jgi:YD repeat-containing protein
MVTGSTERHCHGRRALPKDQRLDPNLNTINYAYDAAGNVTQVTDQRSQVTSYMYDG